MSNIITLLLIQVILIALNAIFASAEIAVLSINEAKLEKLSNQGNKKAMRLRRLTAEPAKFLATIQVAITLSGFLGSAFAAENFSDPLVDFIIGLGVNIPRASLDAIAVILITLILSYFTLIFGELVPKRIAMKKSEGIALAISGPIGTISVLFKPLVWFLSISTNVILRLIGIDPNAIEDDVSEEDIRMMVDVGGERGTIDKEEMEYIHNIFEFDDLTASEIATHRTDVVILIEEDDDEKWAQVIHDNRFTLYPVCSESADNVIGILNAKDYFRLDNKSRENVMKHAVKPAYFVPKSIKADVLFDNMKKNHFSMAVILDEYGGMIGVVTITDLVEELVGDLVGTVHGINRDPVIEEIGNGVWKITGNITLNAIENATGYEFTDNDFDTLTGLLFDTTGVIPADGEQDINFKVGILNFNITVMEDHQVKFATVRKDEEFIMEEN